MDGGRYNAYRTDLPALEQDGMWELLSIPIIGLTTSSMIMAYMPPCILLSAMKEHYPPINDVK